MKRGWWIEDEASQLQQFYEDFCVGKRPKLVLMAPPQHGKTLSIEDFIAWVFGKNPDLGLIFASYADERGTTVNSHLQRLIEGERYHKVFPDTELPARGSGQGERNSGFFEILSRKGSFRNTTIRGAITGMGLQIGIIDDPIKGRAEAASPTIRNMTWNWLIDDFFSRFADEAGMIMVMTRWHVDDPVGRMVKAFPGIKQLNYEAIAQPNDWSVLRGFRKVGEALFPQFKSLVFLLERKAVMTIASWLSLYQGKPIVVGGGIFPIEKYEVITAIDRKEIKRSIRYYDKAGTKGGRGPETAGVLMHSMKDGTWIIEHVVHGRWSALQREAIIKTLAKIDNRQRTTEVWVEQEPGSGGKESAENTIRKLAGFRVFADKVTGDKDSRAEPYAAQVQGGNVKIMIGEWNTPFLDQHESWPNSALKDMVDAAGGAFAKLEIGESRYDTSMSWV